MSRDILVSKSTGYILDGNGSIPGRGKIFVFAMTFRFALGFIERLFHVVKWLDCDAGCSTHFCAKVYNLWSSTSMSCIHFHGLIL